MNDEVKTGGFGFSSANDAIRGLAASVKPKPRTVEAGPGVRAQAADRVAEEIGFVSRESAKRVTKASKTPAEPMQQLAMRLPISVLREFAKFAEDNDLSYPKALAELLRRERRR